MLLYKLPASPSSPTKSMKTSASPSALHPVSIGTQCYFGREHILLEQHKIPRKLHRNLLYVRMQTNFCSRIQKTLLHINTSFFRSTRNTQGLISFKVLLKVRGQRKPLNKTRNTLDYIGKDNHFPIIFIRNTNTIRHQTS